MEESFWFTGSIDHCRIGSLETKLWDIYRMDCDHCRIGSLETKLWDIYRMDCDHCRIGSLEIS